MTGWVVQWLEDLAALLEDPGSIPSTHTHTGQFTITGLAPEI